MRKADTHTDKDLMPSVEDTPDTGSHIEKRNLLLKDIDQETIQKAWFTLAHLLLDEGAKVADMGCDDGAMTYVMAAINPKIKFIGLDKSRRKIVKAREKYKLHNLEFKVGDAASEAFEPESMDAIICSFILHEIYSSSRYNERIVSDTLRKQFRMLKKNGVMFIRDYARPRYGEYVQMEMPDVPSKGKDIAKMSEPDLLKWYSEHARPRQDPGCGGFFLEELPARMPRTRLFRLPAKWAYEFIMRKDDRAHWETELPQEYTFFTIGQFQRELKALGARVQYSAPHWDENIVEKNFLKSLRLYGDDNKPLGPPPTSFIAVAVKLPERKSLHIEERRPSTSEKSSLKITAMRDQVSGRIFDVVSRDTDTHEFIPYRVDEEGRLKVYLHDGIARSIVNTVPRKGINIDGRHWSGHMIEPVTVDDEAIAKLEKLDVKHSTLFARDYLGLQPHDNAVVEIGPDYYPAPDHIDERIQTYYLNVKEPKGSIIPRAFMGYNSSFQAKGVIREMDAQQVLNAITVGLIPSGRLELQIMSLFENLGILTEKSPDSRKINIQATEIKKKRKLKALLQYLNSNDRRFKDVKGTSGQLRPIHSIFVEEGQARGGVTGLSSQDVDFFIHEEKTINTAVVLPLSKDQKKDIHAGFLLEHLPVPQRHEGKSAMISAPSFNMPADISSLQDAKKFVADRMGVSPDMVIKLGESYFSHVGLSPQRIHPFAVVSPLDPKSPDIEFLPYHQLKILNKKLLKKHTHFMIVLARAYKYLDDDFVLQKKLEAKKIVKQRFGLSKPDWALPISFAPGLGKKQESNNKPDDAEKNLAQKLKTKLEEQFKALKSKQASEQENKPQAPQTEAQRHAPAPDNTTEEIIEDIAEDELVDFLEALDEYDLDDKPRPEKW